MKTRIIAAAALGLLLAAPQAHAQAPSAATDPQQGARPATADQFVAKASVANLYEIEAGKIALEQAQDRRVRDFARRMVDDHTEIGADMQAALARSGAPIQAPAEVDDQHREILDRLRAAAPEAFDREYLRSQVQAHDEAVKLFSFYAQRGDNQVLRQFAQQTLPTLQAHYRMARQLSRSIGA